MKNDVLVTNVRRLAAGAAVVVLGLHAVPAGATYYSWLYGQSGLTSDSSKWSPTGVPGTTDRMGFTVSGGYTVTFTLGTPQTTRLTVSAGNPTFWITSPHVTSALSVSFPSLLNSLTVARGSLFTGYVYMGSSGNVTTVTLTSASGTAAYLQSSGTGDPNPGSTGDQIGHDGITQLNLNGGARYVCQRTGAGTGIMAMAVLAGSASTLYITGSGGTPVQSSALLLTGGASMTAGVGGTANVFVTNGGLLDATGDFIMASSSGSGCALSVGTPSSTSPGTFNTHGNLAVGNNLTSVVAAGQGQLLVKNMGVVNAYGPVVLGDPDNDAGSRIQVRSGGTFTAHDGLDVLPVSGPGIDLQGGLMHIASGDFNWPLHKDMTISGWDGPAELRIDNGVSNIGPITNVNLSQLYVARSGDAKLTLHRPGTLLLLGFGDTVVGDSTGGTGTVDVDSTAEFSSNGPVTVGNHGSGVMYVKGGALADLGTLALGAAPGGSGFVETIGSGSTVTARENLWIGGGIGGSGGPATMLVRVGARLEILDRGPGYPAQTTIFQNGHLHAWDGGVVTTAWDISNSGEITLSDGEIDARQVLLNTYSTLRGAGTVAAAVKNNGTMDPGWDPLGGYEHQFTVRIDGAFEQYGSGRCVIDLSTANGPDADRIDVQGPVMLAGTLDLRHITGFAPAPGTYFPVLTGTSITGTFDAVTWNGAPLSGQVEVVYSPTVVGVVVPGTTGVEDPVTHAPAVLRFAPAGDARRPRLSLDLPAESRVTIRLYDVQGRQVATLQDGPLTAARHEFPIPASRYSSGCYFARALVESEGSTEVRTARVVLVR